MTEPVGHKVRVEIDLNARTRTNLVPAWREDADGDMQVGDHVIAFESESKIMAPAVVRGVHVEKEDLFYLAVDFAAATDDPAACPGEERVPNTCGCACEGCKHHCGAHQEKKSAPAARVITECAHCWREIENRSTPNMGGPAHDNWVHLPGRFRPCFPHRGAQSTVATPVPETTDRSETEWII